jgi:hypothetical protein
MLEPAKLSDFGSHDFADHFADIPAQEVTKNLHRLRCGNLPERLQKTNFVRDDLAAGCRRRKLESRRGQILLSERPSFNFQQLLGRFRAKTLRSEVPTDDLKVPKKPLNNKTII